MRIEIFASLEDVLLSGEGELYLVLRKRNKVALPSIVKALRALTGEEVYVAIERGLWSIPISLKASTKTELAQGEAEEDAEAGEEASDPSLS